MHIPLATIPLMSNWLNIWSEKSLVDKDGVDGIVKDGSRINLWLYKSWPEDNLTPLYDPVTCNICYKNDKDEIALHLGIFNLVSYQKY
jgi:hypothetical protein